MKRLAAVAASVALSFSAGCHNNNDWSVRKALGVDGPDNRVKMPDPKTIPAASLAPASVTAASSWVRCSRDRAFRFAARVIVMRTTSPSRSTLGAPSVMA